MREVREVPYIYTIGYGHRPIEQLILLFAQFGIGYVTDVRSKPVSRNDDYCGPRLRQHLRSSGIAYVFMGHLLGGRPRSPHLYTEGYADYEKMMASQEFKAGLTRLVTAHEKGIRVAILCAETLPERCHRSKLIGEALHRLGIATGHIDENGTAISQSQVRERLDRGEPSLFGLPAGSVRSSRRLA